MSDTPISNTHAKDTDEKRPPGLDLEVWKHFAGMGGTDKNTRCGVLSKVH